MKEIIAIIKLAVFIYSVDLYFDMRYWYGIPDLEIGVTVFAFIAIWLFYFIKKIQLCKKRMLKYIGIFILLLIGSKLFTEGDFLFDSIDYFIKSKVSTAQIIIGTSFIIVLEPFLLFLLKNKEQRSEDHNNILDA